MPEAALARELGLAYACLAVVVNPAAGVGASSNAISLDDISKVMDSAMAEVVKVLSVLGR
jgi:5'-methylthioinosine phosphorylase